MAYTSIFIHVVWGTQSRNKILTHEIKPKVIGHIQEYALSKEIHIVSINGYFDHIHILISLSKDQNIAKIVQLMKGESSHWINKNQIYGFIFRWADEYYAASVSPTNINSVVEYIKNQESHHKVKSFEEECKLFLTNYNKYDEKD